MRSLTQFIVKPVNNQRYNNTQNFDGIDFVVNVSTENHLYANREAEVVETPLSYEGEIKKGDILLVHHNIFKHYYDTAGRLVDSRAFIKDNLFFVDTETFFMYKSNGTWNAVDRYCFVEPIPVTQTEVFKRTDEEPLTAIMRYPNEYLSSLGVKPGVKVIFKPDIEYEFQVDGVKMYRIYDHAICAKK
jgi:hypothetical protein